MSEAERTAKLIGLRLSRPVRLAAEILERHGQRFCVDFGYHNAVDKAAAIRPSDFPSEPSGRRS